MKANQCPGRQQPRLFPPGSHISHPRRTLACSLARSEDANSSSPAEICVVDKQETEKHACLIFQKQLKVLVPSQGPALNDEVSASSSSSVELSEAKITGRPQMLSSDEVHTHTHFFPRLFIIHEPLK